MTLWLLSHKTRQRDPRKHLWTILHSLTVFFSEATPNFWRLIRRYTQPQIHVNLIHFFRENQFLAGEGNPKVVVASSGPVGSAVFVLSEGSWQLIPANHFFQLGWRARECAIHSLNKENLETVWHGRPKLCFPSPTRSLQTPYRGASKNLGVELCSLQHPWEIAKCSAQKRFISPNFGK